MNCVDNRTIIVMIITQVIYTLFVGAVFPSIFPPYLSANEGIMWCILGFTKYLRHYIILRFVEIEIQHERLCRHLRIEHNLKDLFPSYKSIRDFVYVDISIRWKHPFNIYVYIFYIDIHILHHTISSDNTICIINLSQYNHNLHKTY